MDVISKIRLHKTEMFILLADFLYSLLGLHVLVKQAATLERNCAMSLRIEGNLSPQPAGNWSPQSSNPQRGEFCEQPYVLCSKSFPSQVFR